MQKTVLIVILLYSINVYANNNYLTIVTSAMNPPYKLNYQLFDNNKRNFTTSFLASHSKNSKVSTQELINTLNDINMLVYDALKTAGPNLAKEQQKRVNFQDLLFYGKAIVPEKSDKMDILLFHDERKEKGTAFLKELLENQNIKKHSGNNKMLQGDILIYGKLTNRQWQKFGEYFTRGYKKGDFQKASMGIYNAYDGASVFDYIKLKPEDFEDQNYEQISKDIEDVTIKLLAKAFTNGVPNTHKTVNFTIDNKEQKVSTANMVQDATGGF